LHPTRCISVCFSRLCQCSSSFSLCVRQLSSSTYCSTILTTLYAILSRTYRHGTPARLPARSTTAPKTPGSRETPTNPIQGSGSGPVGGGRNSRAVSPSPIGSRISREGLSSNKTINNNSNNNTSSSTLRNQSPGTRGLIGRDFSNTTRTRGSFEVESLGDNMSTGYSISDASHDSRMPARAYSASKLRGSTPVRYTRPQSPGTRKGATPSMASVYSSTSSLSARCPTPTRGSWKF
jgi:hypothetical protein